MGQAVVEKKDFDFIVVGGDISLINLQNTLLTSQAVLLVMSLLDVSRKAQQSLSLSSKLDLGIFLQFTLLICF
jgi:hypothetical protein